MPITSADGVIAGFQAPVPIAKVGVTMAVAGSMRAHTQWYAPGSPGASVATAIGVNGQAVTPGLGTSVDGRIRRTNPVSGNAYLGRLAITANQTGVLMLVDRLWHNSGLVTTSITAQAITPAALPARSGDGTVNGRDVLAAIEWSGAGGAGTPTVTLTYTDQDGNAGASAVMTGVASPPVGTFEMFTLAPGDFGIRSVQSFIQSATRTSGAMHLVLFRVLAQVEITAANIGNAIDALTSGLPRHYDDTTVQIVWVQSGATAVTILGQYIETQG